MATLNVAVTAAFSKYGTVFVKMRRDPQNMPFAFCQYTVRYQPRNLQPRLAITMTHMMNTEGYRCGPGLEVGQRHHDPWPALPHRDGESQP